MSITVRSQMSVRLLGTRTRRERAGHHVIGVPEIGRNSCVWYADSRCVLCHVVHVLL